MSLSEGMITDAQLLEAFGIDRGYIPETAMAQALRPVADLAIAAYIDGKNNEMRSMAKIFRAAADGPWSHSMTAEVQHRQAILQDVFGSIAAVFEKEVQP